jgi:polygalacturonase
MRRDRIDCFDMRGGITRRALLKTGLAAAAASAFPRCVHFVGSKPPPFPPDLPQTTPWPEANAILAATALPAIPAALFPVVEYGAKGDGRADDTQAFAAALAACNRAGGGHVMVPAGAYLVGAIRLLSNVDLNLAAGATLLFSGDARLYPAVLTRYEGIECVNRSPMIYAFGESNLSLTGSGALDASRTADWNSGSDREGVLEPLVARGVAPADRVISGRLRTAFVEPYSCTNVLIQGVTLAGAQFWQLHPTLCTNVTIDGVTTTVAGANSDGCDPESCQRVVIKHSTLASGDDNVAIKSGRDDDGRRRIGAPCRDLVIMNCQAEGRFGFITCGSELTGGIENVYAFNNWTYGQGVGSVLWVKSNSRRGGYTRNVQVDTFVADGLRSAAIAMTMSYGDQTGPYPPAFRDFKLRNLTVSGAPRVLDLDGLAQSPIGALELRDSNFLGIGDPAIRLNNAAGIILSNVSINGRAAG